MNNMSRFTDANGRDWSFDIKVKDIESIKRYCKDREGKPLDLFAILDRGNFEVFVNDVELVVNIVFVLCYEEVKKHFNLADYDGAMRTEYEMFPELKSESEMFKAARWFSGQLNGQALAALLDAFQEAIIDFFPNESRKPALKKIREKSKELEIMQCEMMIHQIDEAMPKVQAEMRRQLQGQFQESLSDALSGSMPESSDVSRAPSASGS